MNLSQLLLFWIFLKWQNCHASANKTLSPKALAHILRTVYIEHRLVPAGDKGILYLANDRNCFSEIAKRLKMEGKTTVIVAKVLQNGTTFPLMIANSGSQSRHKRIAAITSANLFLRKHRRVHMAQSLGNLTKMSASVTAEPCDKFSKAISLRVEKRNESASNSDLATYDVQVTEKVWLDSKTVIISHDQRTITEFNVTVSEDVTAFKESLERFVLRYTGTITQENEDTIMHSITHCTNALKAITGFQDAHSGIIKCSKMCRRDGSSLSHAVSVLEKLEISETLFNIEVLSSVKSVLLNFARSMEEAGKKLAKLKNTNERFASSATSSALPVEEITLPNGNYVLQGDIVYVGIFASKIQNCRGKSPQVFATTSIIVSTNLTLFGCSIAFIAPVVEFCSTCAIRMRGETGGQFPNDTCLFPNVLAGRVGGTAGTITIISDEVINPDGSSKILSIGGQGGDAKTTWPFFQYPAPGRGGFPGNIISLVEKGNLNSQHQLGLSGTCSSWGYFLEIPNPFGNTDARNRHAFSCAKPPQNFEEDGEILKHPWCDPAEKAVQPTQVDVHENLHNYMKFVLTSIRVKNHVGKALSGVFTASKLRYLSAHDLANLTEAVLNQHVPSTEPEKVMVNKFLETASIHAMKILKENAALESSKRSVQCDLNQNHCSINVKGREVSIRDCLNGGMFWFADIGACSTNFMRYRDPFHPWCNAPNHFEYVDWFQQKDDDIEGRPESCLSIKEKNITLLSHQELENATDSDGDSWLGLGYAKVFLNTNSSVFLNMPSFVSGGTACHASHVYSNATRMRAGGPLFQKCDGAEWMDECVEKLNFPRLDAVPILCNSTTEDTMRPLTGEERKMLLLITAFFERSAGNLDNYNGDIFVSDVPEFLEKSRAAIDEFVSLEDQKETESKEEILRRQKMRTKIVQTEATERRNQIDGVLQKAESFRMKMSSRFDDLKKKLELLVLQKIASVVSANGGANAIQLLSNVLSVANALTLFPSGLILHIPHAMVNVTDKWLSFNGLASTTNTTELQKELKSAVDALHALQQIPYQKHEILVDRIVGSIRELALNATADERRSILLEKIQARALERQTHVQNWSALHDFAIKISEKAGQLIVSCDAAESREVLVLSKMLSLIANKGVDFNVINDLSNVTGFKNELLTTNLQHDLSAVNLRLALSNATVDPLRRMYNFFNKTTNLDFFDLASMQEWAVAELTNLAVTVATVYTWIQPEETAGFKFLNDFNSVQKHLMAFANVLPRLKKYHWVKMAAVAMENLEKELEDWTDMQNDDEKTHAFLKYQMLLRLSDVLHLYKSAVTAFVQHSFPFAELHLEDLFEVRSPRTKKPLSGGVTFVGKKLSANLATLLRRVKDVDDIARPGVNDHVKTRDFRTLDDEEEEDDPFLFPPFYTWDTGYHFEISNLLKGDDITTDADLLRSGHINLHAINFKFVNVSFHLDVNSRRFPCSGTKKEFEEAIKLYEIEMTHSGKSYYRWGNEFYMTRGPEFGLVFSFVTTTGSNGKKVPRTRSKTYDKMLDGGIRVSPYSSWTFKLIPLNPTTGFTPLKPFTTCDVTMSLVGVGTYCDRTLAFNRSMDLHLDEHYTKVEFLNQVELAGQTPIPALNREGGIPTVFEELGRLPGTNATSKGHAMKATDVMDPSGEDELPEDRTMRLLKKVGGF